MPTILLTNKYSEKVLNVVRKELPEGFDFISLQNTSKDNLLQKATDANYFLASGRIYIDSEVIESAKKLKMVQRTGVGTDSLDLKTLKDKGIPVYLNSGINAASVAEHAILLILAVLRRLTYLDSSVRMGKWEKNDIGVECRSLQGKKVGIIGMGNIGKYLSKLLQPFGVTIFYFDLFRLPEVEEKELNIKYCDLRNLLAEIDILSLHCPLTPETKELMGGFEFSLMKQGSIIINTARGQLINETALIESLQSGHIGGAGLDVFSKEPPNHYNPLFNLSNVVLSPHVGGLSLETFAKMMKDAFKNIKLFENHQFDLIENNRLI